MDTFQRLLFGFSRQQDGQRLPPSRKLSSANLSNDTAQPVAPSSARSSVRMSSETTESRILPSGVHSQGNVSSGRAAIDKTQSMPRQSTSRVRRGNSVADENTEHPPSALPTSFGNSIPTSLTEHSPQVPLEDCPKDYGIEAPSSGTPYDARPHGPESGPRPTFKPPTTPSPLRHEDASRADNSAVLTSTTALRRSGGSHGSDAVSSQTIHPPRPSIHRNDSLESRNISNEMTQSQGVASPLPCGGTSDAITNGAQAQSFAPTNNVRLHRPDLASRPTTQSQMALPSTSVDCSRRREPDTAIRQSIQPPGAVSSLSRGGTPGSYGMRVHIQQSETLFHVHFDELDCAPSQTTETPPTPECQNYERTCDDPSKELFIADYESPSKEMDSGRDNRSSTTPNQTIDPQSSNGSSNRELPNMLDDELQEDGLDDLTAEDIIIVMMGPTGTGKSSFVAKATNSGDEGVGHTLFSHTSEIRTTRCTIGGSNVVLVDTPGSDDTTKTDQQILESISNWLNKSYKKSTLLSGILYFHRISDNRMAGTLLKNLGVFQKLCGDKALSHVVLVTTMWDEVEESVGNMRLEELEGNYWKMMIAQGSTTYRYVNTPESSRQLLSQVVKKKRCELRLQKQMADKSVKLQETDAGRELRSRSDEDAEKLPEVASSLPRGCTSNVTTNGAFMSTSKVHLRGPDLVSHQTTQSPMVVRSDEFDCASSRVTETPPTSEPQNYERTRDHPSMEACAVDDEPPSKEVDSGCDGRWPITGQQSSNELSGYELPDTLDDGRQEVALDDLTPEDFIIAILGPTGTGKSSFIAKATNSGDEGVGHGLFSHTSKIKATRCIIGGSKVVLVDTPSFDHTNKPDRQIWESIVDWLNKSYKKGNLLSGILYFHRISDKYMAGTPLKNLRVLQKLCGNKGMSHVALVTTMWDEVDEFVGNQRFHELKNNYWRPMILLGSTSYRYENTLESSRQLLSQLVQKKRCELLLQKQMADKNVSLRETNAGQELYSRLDQIAEKRAEILARITAQRHQAGDRATADDLRKQYETLKVELDETLRQVQALKLNPVKRATAYIRKAFK